jgi:HAD superfamily hydrolase (TIGR01509 family)
VDTVRAAGARVCAESVTNLAAMAIKALLFDFDGTLVDTEGPSYRAWKEIFGEHGHDLELERWVSRVGTIGGFDPFHELETLVGRPVDRDAVDTTRMRRRDELVAVELLRAGVREYLDEAHRLGLRVGIVTSGPTDWVAHHLERLGEADGWDCIVCADRDAALAKPAPTLYERALAALELGADEAVAVEDSPNGVRAAKAAGIFCVAIPNSVTAGLDLTEADVRLESLLDLPLEQLLRRADRRAR